jgi:hypothetical protein
MLSQVDPGVSESMCVNPLGGKPLRFVFFESGVDWEGVCADKKFPEPK